MNLPKRLLAYGAGFLLPREGEVTLQLAHVLTVSKALRDNLVTAGVPIEHAHVVYNGIHLHEFRPARLPDANQVPRRLLYAGQLADHKGVHTAIEAMNRLVHQDGCSDLSLTILGSGHPQYEEWLHTMVRRYQLEQHVLFHERVPRQEIPALLKQHDVLLFPSIYEEPLARMPQEAMAVGLVVVGTTTGGSSELLEDGVNGMAFQAEDAAALSDAVLRLVQNPALFRRLATAGQETIRSRFTLERMVQELEVYLCTVLADGVPQRRELSLAEAV